MENIFTFTILLTFFSLAEIISEKTKAILSTTLVLSSLLLVGFWLGLPADIFASSKIDGIGMVLVSFLITSMGTNLDFTSLKNQTSLILLTILSVSIGVFLILILGPYFIGKDLSLAGAPIFSGGNAAVLMLKDVFLDRGMEESYKFALLVLLTQNFIGIPLASLFLKKEAKNFLKDNYKRKKNYPQEKDRLINLGPSFEKPSVYFSKIALVSLLGHYVSSLFQGRIHPFIFLLLFGMIFSELGFLEKNILAKTNSEFFIVFTTTLVIFTGLANTKPQEIINMIIPLIICLSLGVIGVIISGYLGAKLLKTSPYLVISLGLTCTFGFPTTMLMPKEIAKAVTTNPSLEEELLNYLLPPMLTAGFVTVTIFSVFITGFIINII